MVQGRHIIRLCSLLLTCVGFVPAGTIHVEGSAASFGTLQSIVAKAAAGDSVVVHGGVFEGDIVLSRPLALVGFGAPLLRGSGSGSVVTVMADSCEVSGFTIVRSGSMLADEDAGIMIQSDHNVIRNNVLTDILFGIYLWGADRNLIEGNRITGRTELSLGERGSGIHVYTSILNVFRDNIITEMRDGFYILYASRSRIEGCEVYNVRYGLHYMYADSNVFVGNRFHNSVAGAAIMYSRGIRMKRNEFRDNRGFSSYGILFQDCHGLVADSNMITDNATGLFMEASTDNVFRRNVIARNTLALQMFQNSVGNGFSENSFIDNLSPLAIVGRQTESDWSIGGRGNFWSSYGGYDLDGDGIGDVPMKIQNVFQYLEGQTPGARLFLYSPAAQALALAATSFPILDRNKEFDSNPIMRPLVTYAIRAPSGEEPTPQGSGWAVVPAIGLVCGWVVLYQVAGRKGWSASRN